MSGAREDDARRRPAPPPVDAGVLERLRAGDHRTPHDVLGVHAADADGEPGVIVRAFHPDATSAACLLEDGASLPMHREAGGAVFSVFVPGATRDLAYRHRFGFENGETWERGDPYRFPPTLGDVDLHLHGEGTHRRLWEVMGAHPARVEGVDGVRFAVWAPNARRVSVVGDFSGWDGRLYPMRVLGESGVFELFLPGLGVGALYKYEILTREGAIRTKTDPFAAAMERPPGTASRVEASTWRWGDAAWMGARADRDPRREPMAAYEVHLGSWARLPEEGDRPLTYREIAPRLAEYVTRLGFTHVELMPVSEFPFEGSWGYQVSGYYAPTSRYGRPDDFRFLVDHLHQAGLGVILDWVPAHFPKDDFALRRFDGTGLYEHEDPRQGEHPEWGTLVFNLGRPEVVGFLVANALYWLQAFHVDGLRVDAVSSMLYLDYGRKEGEWVPNEQGGRENHDAIRFFQRLHEAIQAEAPGCFTVAEEASAWPGVTRPVDDGGLGFTLKWNMGWMHDTLRYLARDPVHRKPNHDEITFAMLYEYGEAYLMPLSHDEVVHGKGSLWRRMPGDPWQKLANLRLLFTYQWTRPGKQLLFMGGEFAQEKEWWHEVSLDWHLLEDPARRGLQRFFEALGALYREHPCLWRTDPDPAGFQWISCDDRDNSVLVYTRRDGDDVLVVALNFTPIPREGYAIGAPRAGAWVERLCSDDEGYGGSDVETPKRLETQPVALHGFAQSLVLRLPPLGAVVLAPEA